MHDLRYSLRSIRRAPWLSASTVAVIAVGIALAATVFAIVDGILFKPLPYRAPDELIVVRGILAAPDRTDEPAVSPSELAAWRAAVPEVQFSAQGMVIGFGTLGVVNGPTVWSHAIDEQFWETLGVRPAVGGFVAQDFDAPSDESAAGATGTAGSRTVISYALWQRLFGGRDDILSQRIDAGRQSFSIAGVLPRDFVFPTGDTQVVPDLLMPASRRGASSSDSTSRYLNVIARVPDGVDRVALAARLTQVARETWPAGAKAPAFERVTLTPLREVMTQHSAVSARLAAAAAGVILLLVALNVGGLVSARARDRARETAARRALGASSVGLARLYAVEIGLLAAAGAVLGVIAARFLLIETARRLPSDLVLQRAPEVDARVIVAVVVAALAVAGAATLFALRAVDRVSLTSLLGQGAGASVRRHRTTSRFVFEAGQVALALALAVGGALFLASLSRAWQADTGHALAEASFLEVRLGPAPDAAAGSSAHRTLELLERIRATPGVERAALMDTILLADMRRGSTLRPVDGVEESPVGELIPVSSGFFDLAGIDVVAGRLPTDQEMDAGDPVAVVSERTARAYWPGRDAVGRALSSKRGTLTVIGVVRDARLQRLDRESEGEIYAPLRLGLYATTAANYLIRTRLPESQWMPLVLEGVRQYDPRATVRRAQSVSVALAESIRGRRFHAWLFGGLAAAGIIVAGAGVFGLVASGVARRRREMGVRVALGSTREQLVRLMLREQLMPVVAGIVVGGLVTVWAVGLARPLLYELSEYNVLVWAAAAVTVLGVAAAATLVPALRTARVDPVSALRAE